MHFYRDLSVIECFETAYASHDLNAHVNIQSKAVFEPVVDEGPAVIF